MHNQKVHAPPSPQSFDHWAMARCITGEFARPGGTIMLRIGTAVVFGVAITLGGCANTDRVGSGPKEGTGTALGALSGALIGSTIGGTAGDRVAAAVAGAA